MHILIKNKSLIFNNYKVKCALGKRGIAFKRKEGDLITPIGEFKIKYILYRKDRVKNIKSKLKKKGCDFIVANDVSLGTQTMGGDENTAILVGEEISEQLPTMSKRALAETLVEKISQSFEEMDA